MNRQTAANRVFFRVEMWERLQKYAHPFQLVRETEVSNTRSLNERNVTMFFSSFITEFE